MDEQKNTPTNLRKIVNLSKRTQEQFVGKALMTPHDMRDELTKLVDHYGGQKALADILGISTTYLGDILHGKRGVSAEVAEKLGWKREVVFVR